MAGEILIPACVDVLNHLKSQFVTVESEFLHFLIQVDTSPGRASTNVIDTQAALWVLGFQFGKRQLGGSKGTGT